MKKQNHITEIRRLKRVKLKNSCIIATCKVCDKKCQVIGTQKYNKALKILNNKLTELTT